MPVPLYDERRADRSKAQLPTGLRVMYRDAQVVRREVMAQLVDVSRSGVGVEARIALAEQQEVELRGDLRAEGLDLRLDATAEVVYCRAIDEAAYRVGFHFIEAAFARAS